MKSEKKGSGSYKNGTIDRRLVGWLVSYGLDKKGFNYEIRSGRTLISASGSQSIPTLELDNQSISELHLVLNATQKHKVTVQDIFSEAGSYLTRNKEKKEIKIDGPVDLQHGDWLRVGDNIRFQVCLIDGPSR